MLLELASKRATAPAGKPTNGSPAFPGSETALVLGRAVHEPWNEGSRVITWNFARAISAVRSVHVLSLTRAQFAGYRSDQLLLTHVYTDASGGALGDYGALRRLAYHVDDLLRSEAVDVVHLIGLPLALSPLIRRRGARLVFHLTLAQHAYQGPVERLRAVVGWRLFDRWIDAYAVSSPALQGPLAGRGMPASKLCVIPAAIDADCFAPGDRHAARQALGVGDDEPLVVYIGTLSPVRFPASCVGQSLARVSHQLDRPLRFSAFAPLATHAYNKAWTEEAVRAFRGLAGVQAEFSLSDLSPAGKREWLRAADVVLLPFAGQVAVEPPLTLLEAMACGATVLVTPEANRSNLVRSGENGFVYHTSGEMERLLQMVLQERGDSRCALRISASKTVVERHSMPVAAGAALRIWETLRKDRAPWQ